MLISLHLPKTAGNSLLLALNSAFGEKNLFQDYSDMIRIQEYLAGKLSAQETFEGQNRQDVMANYQCIHGHFLPAKYFSLLKKTDLKFITFLRNPVERLISQYHFFQRSYDPQTAGPLFRKIIEENWSLEQFCFSEEYHNIYSKYLLGFSYESFDFIGLTEFYEDDLLYFSDKLLQVKLDSHKVNCAVDNKVGDYKVDSGFRREVESFHSKDMTLYTRVLQDREQR